MEWREPSLRGFFPIPSMYSLLRKQQQQNSAYWESEWVSEESENGALEQLFPTYNVLLLHCVVCEERWWWGEKHNGASFDEWWWLIQSAYVVPIPKTGEIPTLLNDMVLYQILVHMKMRTHVSGLCVYGVQKTPVTRTAFNFADTKMSHLSILF